MPQGPHCGSARYDATRRDVAREARWLEGLRSWCVDTSLADRLSPPPCHRQADQVHVCVCCVFPRALIAFDAAACSGPSCTARHAWRARAVRVGAWGAVSEWSKLGRRQKSARLRPVRSKEKAARPRHLRAEERRRRKGFSSSMAMEWEFASEQD